MSARGGPPAPRVRPGRSGLATLSIAALLCGLVVAMAWDADGDPATDNVPVVTLAASETDVVSHDASRATDEPTGRSGPLTAWARRLLERRVGRCQLRWLPRAVPARGP